MNRPAPLWLALLAVPALPAHAQDPCGPAEVFVVATLYRRHAEVPAYRHDTLRAIVGRIRPDALVLDVSPRELREQTVHPSKAEYPQVTFRCCAREVCARTPRAG